MGLDGQTTALGRGTGIPVDDLVDDACRLSRADFEEAYGNAFLMLGSIDEAAPAGPGTTMVQLPMPADPGAQGSSFDPRVHPIRRTGRSVGHLVSLGRTSNNDVVISDVSVSRFHAFLKQGVAEASWTIQDAGSKNGTIVNGRRVPLQGKGAPVALKSGDRVRVGQVELTFFEAELLIRLLRGGR